MEWQVRARDAAGNWSDWSAVPSQVTITSPMAGTSTLSAPANNLVTNDDTPEFAWGAAAYGVDYEIQIATNTAFTTGVQISPRTSSPYTFASPLGDAKYYWRVRAYNNLNQAGAWSAVFAVTVDRTAPVVPTIVKPADNFVSRGVVAFQWSGVAGASHYQLQIDEDGGDFTAADYDSGWTVSTTVTPPFSTLGNWDWRVRARDAAGNVGDWTTVRGLSIIQPLPVAPLLSSPAVNGTTNDNTPTFVWGSVTWGSTYQIQVDNSNNFASPERDYTTGTGVTTYTPSVLADGTWYWRVRAYNTNSSPEAGAWSATRTLIIGNYP
jgi:hypothetical protein